MNQGDNTSITTVADSVKEVLKTLPPVLRTYLSQKKYMPVIQGLARVYNLRVDQGGVLERELVFLLMGIENPDEFIEALVIEGNIPRQTVSNIVRDVNTQIFVPLRAEERGSVAQTLRPSAPPPSGSQSHFHLQNKIAPPPRPTGSPTARPALREALASAMDSSKLLEDHEEPHIELGKKTASLAPSPSARPPVPPPQNLPGQMSPAAPVAPRVIPPGGRAAPVSGAAIGIPPAPPTPPVPQKPEIPTSYSVDPYREPIDEPEK